MKLDYFSKSEFERGGVNWYDQCSPELLVKLDIFRHLTGKCIISPHPLAIGRKGYEKNPDSQHNVKKWGEVRGIDIFPILEDYLRTKDNVKLWIKYSKKVGFRGIGIYPEWTYNGKKRIGMHVDVREYREIGDPATWGVMGGEMVSIDVVLEKL